MTEPDIERAHSIARDILDDLIRNDPDAAEIIFAIVQMILDRVLHGQPKAAYLWMRALNIGLRAMAERRGGGAYQLMQVYDTKAPARMH